MKKFAPQNRKTMLLYWLIGFLMVGSLVMCAMSSYFKIYPSSNVQPLPSVTASIPQASATSGNTTPLVIPNEPVPSATPNEPAFFYGETIDMSQILPTSQHYVVNSQGQDLIDIAASLGINLVRIINTARSFDNDADSIYTAEQWNQVLSKMQRKGIKALILIETASNNGDYYTPDIRPIYLHLVQKYIDSGVFANPNVYAVDIKNEPLLTDANLQMLQDAHAMIKAKYPNLKQTVGWWATPKVPEDPYNPDNYDWSNYSTGQRLANIVDFYSVHMYGLGISNDAIGLNPNLRTKLFLSQVQQELQTTKPIVIEEFGEANGDAVSDQATIGSPELQANVYQGVYQALEEMHSSQIVGAVAFDFCLCSQYPDAWAIVKDNGNYLFPAAYILQEYALGEKNPSLRAATVVTSQSYLFKDDDNLSTKNLHISDRIGLKLQLDGSKTYSLSFSIPGMFQLLEPFQYSYASRAYSAVYLATTKGSVELNILCDGKVIYSLNINVQ